MTLLALAATVVVICNFQVSSPVLFSVQLVLLAIYCLFALTHPCMELLVPTCCNTVIPTEYIAVVFVTQRCFKNVLLFLTFLITLVAHFAFG